MRGNGRMLAYLLIGSILILGIGLYWANSTKSSASVKPAERPSAPVAIELDDQEIQEKQFWALIERTLEHQDSQEMQALALQKELEALSVRDIEKFSSVFDRLMQKTYSWDLWGAAYVIRGGASDDSFEDFRKWLISKGEDYFIKAVEDPERLAEMIESDPSVAVTFEEFSYIPMEVWSKKTGKDPSDLPKDKGALYPADPIGEPFEEDAVYLAQRYPSLWKRFGEHPLE